jgi:hypothetical protein
MVYPLRQAFFPYHLAIPVQLFHVPRIVRDSIDAGVCCTGNDCTLHVLPQVICVLGRAEPANTTPRQVRARSCFWSAVESEMLLGLSYSGHHDAVSGEEESQ